MSKYIIYVYKILSEEYPVEIFISSSSIKDTRILPLGSKFEKWSAKMDKLLLKKKLIKGYPVSNDEDEEIKTRYWINKYKKYGYIVSSYLEEKEDKKYKLYVCLENVSIMEVTAIFGDKIISISKENNITESLPSLDPLPPLLPFSSPEPCFPTESKTIKPPLKKNIIKYKKSKIKNEISGGNYLDELKNVLQRRNSDINIKIEDLVKKRKKPKKLALKKKGMYDNFLDELKSKIQITL